MTQTQATAGELKAVVHIVAAVAEAIQSLGEVPSGHLYAMLQGKVTFEQYSQIIQVLTGAGLVEDRSHLLHWIGPKGGAQ